MCATVYELRRLVKATEVTEGPVESNGSLLQRACMGPGFIIPTIYGHKRIMEQRSVKIWKTRGTKYNRGYKDIFYSATWPVLGAMLATSMVNAN